MIKAVGVLRFLATIRNILGDMNRQKTHKAKDNNSASMCSELVEIEAILIGSTAGLSTEDVDEIMKELELSINRKLRSQ